MPDPTTTHPPPTSIRSPDTRTSILPGRLIPSPCSVLNHSSSGTIPYATKWARSRGAACGRIFHDADSREKPPRMRQRRSTDRIQAVAITAFASKRSNQRSKFLRVDLNALQIGEGTKRHEQMRGFACRHHAGCESGHTQHVGLDRNGASQRCTLR